LRVGLLGDLHGRVLHGLAILLEWQRRSGRRLDLALQVGDLGLPTEPDPATLDPAARRYWEADPSEGDLARLLRAAGRRADNLRRARERLSGPVLFLRGNHEDFGWLAGLPTDAAADPFDLFRYAPDGTLLELDGLRIACLGGVEEQRDAAEIDWPAYERLSALGPGRVDLLVTHEGPYGTSVGFRGDVHGSAAISRLVERLGPRWHVAGHAHVLHGPRRFGPTVYLGVDCVVASPVWEPEKTGLQPGCLAVLDTETAALEPVLDGWLTGFDRRFDFDAFIEAL
jgi:hypothetical protein